MCVKSSCINRRSFLKASSLLGCNLMVGAIGFSTVTSCSNSPEWKSIHYPRAILYNLRLFDGVRNHLQNGKSLLIEKNKIIGIEDNFDQSQYKDYKHINLNGWTLLPGFIDNHVHVTSPFISGENLNVLFDINEQIELNLKNCVLSGVTTVRDVGGFPQLIRKYQERSDKNEIPGPRVSSSMSMIAAREGGQLGWPVRAKYIENPIIKWKMGGNFAERPTTENEVKETCQEMISLGATWLKTLHHDQSLNYQAFKLPNHTDEEYRVILKMGKDAGIKCAMHAMLISGFKKGVDLGYHTYLKFMFPNIIKNVEKLKAGGAKIGVGTDSGGSPLALFGFYVDELKYLASTSLSNLEVLKMATAENAQILDLQDKIGTLEKGKLADLIAVEGNPLDDLEAIGKIKIVMKGGHFIKAEGITGKS